MSKRTIRTADDAGSDAHIPVIQSGAPTPALSL